MKLSNKKIKNVQRLSKKKSPTEIAKQLNIDVDLVQLALKTKHPTQEKKSTNKSYLQLSYLIAGGLLLASFINIDSLYEFAQLPQEVLATLCGFIVFSAWLYLERNNLSFEIRLNNTSLSLLMLILLSFISMFYATNKLAGLYTALHWFGVALLFIVVSYLAKDKKTYEVIFIAVFAIGFLTAIIGNLQYLFNFALYKQVIKPAASFANKNFAAQIGVIALPLALYLFLKAKTSQKNNFYASSLVLMLTFILYGQTRAAWLSVGVQVLFFCTLQVRNFFIRKDELIAKNKVFYLIGILMIVFFAIHFDDKGFHTNVDHISKKVTETVDAIKNTRPSQAEVKSQDSANLRLAIWQNTFAMIKDYPILGVGLNNHKVHYAKYYRSIVVDKTFGEASQLSYVHNEYLQLLAELGIIGFSIFCFFAFTIFRLCAKLIFSKEKSDAPYSEAIVISIIGLVINSFFSFPFHRGVPPLLFMALLGLLYAKHSPTAKVSILLNTPSFRKSALTIFTITTIVISFYSYRRLIADKLFYQSQAAEKTKDYNLMTEKALEGYRLDPTRKKLLFFASKGLIETKQPAKSVKLLKQLLKVNPNYMNGWLNLGISYRLQKKYAQAEVAFNKVKQTIPTFIKAYQNLAFTYIEQGHYAKAEKEIQEALRVDANSENNYYLLGIMYFKSLQYQESAQAFSKAVAIKNNWPEVHRNLGVLYYEHLHDKKMALFHLETAIHQNPKIPQANALRGLIIKLKGKL